MCDGCAKAPDPDPGEAVDRLVETITARSEFRRCFVSISGVPGAGKSAFAETLAVRLNTETARKAVVLPTDGFLFDDAVLRATKRSGQKGAPDTFDVAGLRSILRRLRANTEAAVAVPVFDRDLDIVRGGARLIPRSTDVLLVVGDYLLSRETPWTSLQEAFDLSVMLTAPDTLMRKRLVARWRDLGHPQAEAEARVERNLHRNAQFVRETSGEPDVVLASTT